MYIKLCWKSCEMHTCQLSLFWPPPPPKKKGWGNKWFYHLSVLFTKTCLMIFKDFLSICPCFIGFRGGRYGNVILNFLFSTLYSSLFTIQNFRNINRLLLFKNTQSLVMHTWYAYYCCMCLVPLYTQGIWWWHMPCITLSHQYPCPCRLYSDCMNRPYALTSQRVTSP